jgi:negative regulator of flagellin synthesis FlgM
MRIDLNADTNIAETKLDKSGSARPPAASAQTPAESQFSLNQASVSGLLSAALAAPEVRQEKVDALKAQMMSGVYQVSSQQIASSMLEAMHAAG